MRPAGTGDVLAHGANSSGSEICAPFWTLLAVKVTLTVQDAPAAIEVPHVLVWAKSPLVEIDETDAAELVGLETVSAPLVEPVTTEPKFSALGATDTPEFG